MAKRRASQELETLTEPDLDGVQITPLGAGQEVGRSCIILSYLGKKVMFDCGVHPGLSGVSSLPFLDSEELHTVDAALITHFHLDHCAAVPYLIGRTNFKGRLIMTHPTKAIMNTLLRDFLKQSAGSADEALYSEAHLDAALEAAEVLDFDQTLDLGGFKVTPYRAGHVLGAAMFLVEIGGMRALYTGDYSRVTDRHLSAADIPPVKPHIVIVESTYGILKHLPREVREKRFTDKIHATVMRGGRVLLPIVALGRAQELLLLLDEYWSRRPELVGVPIYQASGLARKALTVYQTYLEMMNEDIRAALVHRNPFHFKHVQVVKGTGSLDESGPCVMMATPSMLQSGLSRDLFEAWCEDARNTVIIADFAVQGTLARDILNNPTHIMTRAGVKVPLRCSVEAISFSAHADYEQTSGFLDTLQPPHVVLVHGEAEQMARLKQALERTAHTNKWDRTVHNPRVLSTITIPFTPQHTADVIGRLAEQPLKPGDHLAGLLVKKGTQHLLMHPEDLPTFTKLHTGHVTHRQAVPVNKPFSELRLALEIMFEGVEGSGLHPVRTGASPGSSPPRVGPSGPPPAASAAAAAAGGGGAGTGDGGAAPTAGEGVSKVEDVKGQLEQKPLDNQQQQHQQAEQKEQQEQKVGPSSSSPAEAGAGAAGSSSRAASGALNLPAPEVGSCSRQPQQQAAAAASPSGQPPGVEGEEAVNVNGLVTVRYRPAAPMKGYGSHVVVEWEGGTQGDLMADAVIAVLLQTAGEPPGASAAEAARRAALAQGDAAGAAAAELALAAELLRAQFGGVEVDAEQGLLVVDLDGVECVVDVALNKVSCAEERLRARVERVMQRVAEAMRPCVLNYED